MAYSVTLEKFISRLKLEILHVPGEIDKIQITSTEVNRPGLLISGFSENFDPTRIQILGKMEFSYLDSLNDDVKMQRINDLFRRNVPAVIITRNMFISADIVQAARIHSIPLLRTTEETSTFMAEAIVFLNNELAPRIQRHGVLVEVYGEGILITGDSGIGKSETAIELIKRGHRLIADDAVEIKRVSDRTLVGTAPEIIRHFIELRGIGIVDVRRIFGMGAIKDTERIDLIINLEPWVEGKMYDRLGLDNQYNDILGLSIPSLTVPVRPGRNLAVIIEVAAMNHRHKSMGYNAAKELNERMMKSMGMNQ